MPPQSRGFLRRQEIRSSSDPTSGSSEPSTERIIAEQPADFDDEDGDGDSDSNSSLDRPSLIRVSSEDENGKSSSLHADPRPNLTPRSNSYGPAAFAPPFYNRPPTPLPPSPSLTSLLRPLPFSAPISHTTTPESSDTESAVNATLGLTPTAAAAANSAPVPRASPKVPTYEYYGFVVYLGSSLAFLMYLLWSYLPTPFLHQLGIYYYPNRWWSLAVPAWLVVAVLYIYVALAAWNTGVLTLPLSSLECFVDEKAQVAVVDSKGKIVSAKEKLAGKRKAEHDSTGYYGRLGVDGRKASGNRGNDTVTEDLNWREIWSKSTDAVMDVPIGGVCEILYGSGRDKEIEEAED